MNSKGTTTLALLLTLCFCLQMPVSARGATDDRNRPVGRLVSLQGEAQAQRAGLSAWDRVEIDANFYPGDMLRVLANGRAAIVLDNETVLRIDQNSTMSFTSPPADNYRILELFRGVLHIFSHRPRSLQVITPYVNGVVEGTEFLVRVEADTSRITVFEGKVAAVNQQGRLDLASGQSATATKGLAPVMTAVVRPRDSVEWTLYYPVIYDSFDVITNDVNRAGIGRSAADLFVGKVDEARKALGEIRQDDPENCEALALLSIIATVLNNKDEALELAVRAITSNSRSAAANLALSYPQQARFDIPGALKTLEQAEQANSQNGLVKARLAELLLAVGEMDRALAKAREAAVVNPHDGLSQTVLGFAHLSRVETEEALAAFNKALLLDSALPLARLGLGLARIRTGKLQEGRAELEIAAALDPGNALIRSYLGKAYFEEKREDHARRQYSIARQLDPADPTPWFYGAIQNQTTNRPVEALHDLQQSIDRNDNRAVYRSRLLLDGDLAARSAGLGRIYTDLGFQQLASAEGWKSVQADPANYSAHRFLADSYSNVPRHEVARVSELLRSQLLQPLNVTPVQPQLAESNLAILEGTGPSLASFNEFNPLFLRDRITLQTSGVAGSNGIWGDELVVAGVEGQFSYSRGQFHYQTDGIRDNNDQEQNIQNGFFQAMTSPTTSLLAEVRHRKKDSGDLTFQFDPNEFSNSLRQSEETSSARFGVRHDLSPQSTLLGTAIVGSDDGSAATGGDGFSLSIDLDSEVESQMVEVQHIYRRDSYNVESGVGYLHGDETFTASITAPFVSFAEDDSNTEHTNVYSYGHFNLSNDIATTLGLSGDLLDSPRKDREELNPKLGVTWQPANTTLIRAAAFKTVARRFIHAQTIEPTLIAGFNQYFDDLEGSSYWLYGIGVDQRLPADWYGGIQIFHRDLKVPYNDISLSGDLSRLQDDWQEDSGSAYLYWVAANWFTLGVDYHYDHFVHDQFEGEHEIRDLTTNRVVPKIQFFHPSGLSARVQASYIDQEGEIGSSFTGYEKDSDRFWVFDVSIGYRLPHRFGIFKVEVKNLFDERFQFLDTDPARPQYLQEQQIVASLTLAF